MAVELNLLAVLARLHQHQVVRLGVRQRRADRREALRDPAARVDSMGVVPVRARAGARDARARALAAIKHLRSEPAQLLCRQAQAHLRWAAAPHKLPPVARPQLSAAELLLPALRRAEHVNAAALHKRVLPRRLVNQLPEHQAGTLQGTQLSGANPPLQQDGVQNIERQHREGQVLLALWPELIDVHS